MRIPLARDLKGLGVVHVRRLNSARLRYLAILCRAAPIIVASPFSAIMIVGALVLVEVTAGITEASMPSALDTAYFCLSASSIAAMRSGSAASGGMPARSTCNSWPTVLLRVPQPRFIASVNSS